MLQRGVAEEGHVGQLISAHVHVRQLRKLVQIRHLSKCIFGQVESGQFIQREIGMKLR